MSSIARWFVIGVTGFVVVSSISMASPYYCARPSGPWASDCELCQFKHNIMVPLYDENGNPVVVGVHAYVKCESPNGTPSRCLGDNTTSGTARLCEEYTHSCGAVAYAYYDSNCFSQIDMVTDNCEYSWKEASDQGTAGGVNCANVLDGYPFPQP